MLCKFARIIPMLMLPLLANSTHAATIFVSNEKDNTVTVIDSETLKIVKTIDHLTLCPSKT